MHPQKLRKMNTNQYETVIILTPVLSEQQMKDAVTSYRGLITEHGGELVHEENWGLTKLAYPIDKKGTGFYHLFEYKANPEFIKTLDLAFRRDEKVMRYLTVRMDKHAVIFNDRKRKGEFLPNARVAEESKFDKTVKIEVEEI